MRARNRADCEVGALRWSGDGTDSVLGFGKIGRRVREDAAS